jgi:transcription elongation factor Elf1
MPIHHLHEPVDVFSEWLDDCEAAERGEVPAAAASSAASRTGDLSRDGDGGGGTKKNKKKNAVVSNLGLDDSDDDSD